MYHLNTILLKNERASADTRIQLNIFTPWLIFITGLDTNDGAKY